jgi:hypothetical protein
MRTQIKHVDTIDTDKFDDLKKFIEDNKRKIDSLKNDMSRLSVE